MQTIYFDNGATTRQAKEVSQLVLNLQNTYANPSSIHHEGVKAKQIIDDARKIIADSLNASPDEIYFTSGGSESNNLAIKGLAFSNPQKNHIITTKIEHDCILNACNWLKTQGFQITYLSVDQEGFISPKELENAITPKTLLASIIHANNEIGTIQNLKKIYEICKSKNVLLHTDACQSYTKTQISSKDADLITINSHKIHGPKGVGALYVKKGIKLTPLIHGGGHEKGLRAGTENTMSIAGFAKAVQLVKNKKHIEQMRNLRDYFLQEALKLPGTTLNGPKGNSRLCNNINISFSSIEGESIAAMLDLDGICCSTGSACASKSLEPSHVLMALENNPERAHGSIRFTLSRFSTKKEIDFTLKKLKSTIKNLRKISPLQD